MRIPLEKKRAWVTSAEKESCCRVSASLVVAMLFFWLISPLTWAKVMALSQQSSVSHMIDAEDPESLVTCWKSAVEEIPLIGWSRVH